MTGVIAAASAASARHISGATTVTLGSDTRIDSLVNSYRCRGFDVNISTDDRTGAAFGSRSPTSLNGITINSGFSSRDSGGGGAIEFYLGLAGNYVGRNPFVSITKKSGGSPDADGTIARTSAGTPAGTYDGATTWWNWTVTVEWPTSGSRDIVFA